MQHRWEIERHFISDTSSPMFLNVSYLSAKIFSIQNSMQYRVQRQKCLIQIVMLAFWTCPRPFWIFQCRTRIRSMRCAMYAETNTSVAACWRLVRLNRKICVIEINPIFPYSTNHIRDQHDHDQKIHADAFKPAHCATNISWNNGTSFVYVSMHPTIFLLSHSKYSFHFVYSLSSVGRCDRSETSI